MVINLQGDLPSLPHPLSGHRAEPLAEPGFDLATLVAPVASDAEARSESVVRRCAPFPPPCISPAPACPGAPASSGTTSDSTPGAGPRWPASVALPPSPLELARKTGTASRAGGGHADRVARVDHAPFGVDTRRTSRAQDGIMRNDGSIAFQGLPGAYSDLACRTAYPGLPDAALRHVRAGDRGGAYRSRGARHAAVRKLAGRTGAGHPRAAARKRPFHRGANISSAWSIACSPRAAPPWPG